MVADTVEIVGMDRYPFFPFLSKSALSAADIPRQKSKNSSFLASNRGWIFPYPSLIIGRVCDSAESRNYSFTYFPVERGSFESRFFQDRVLREEGDRYDDEGDMAMDSSVGDTGGTFGGFERLANLWMESGGRIAGGFGK